jgi:hypothetical protein
MNTNKIKPLTSTNRAQQGGMDEHQQNTTKELQNEHQQNKTSNEHQ